MTEPGFRSPMLATLSDDPPTGREWMFERKLDGVRLMVVRDGDSVHLWSRNRKDRTELYPELIEPLLGTTPVRFVADGEVVAFDGKVTSFARLQQRGGRGDHQRRSAISIHLYLFDLLHLDGNDLQEVPLRRRKETLRRVVDFEDPIRFCAHRNNHPATGADQAGWSGTEYLSQACERGWEGLIAKKADGRYVNGRSNDWLKLKCVRQQEFVIGGFTDPSGSRAGLGALLVGYHDGDGSLRYAGRVGTGFDEAELVRLRSLLEPEGADRSPFLDAFGRTETRRVHWVEPRRVCEVGFTEWTTAGRLRHPRYLGMRDDKAPPEVVRESPVSTT